MFVEYIDISVCCQIYSKSISQTSTSSASNAVELWDVIETLEFVLYIVSYKRSDFSITLVMVSLCITFYNLYMQGWATSGFILNSGCCCFFFVFFFVENIVTFYGSTLRNGVKSGPAPAVRRPTRCA